MDVAPLGTSLGDAVRACYLGERGYAEPAVRGEGRKKYGPGANGPRPRGL